MTRTMSRSSYSAAVRQLADADPATHPAGEFLERLGAVLDEVPGLSSHRWELMLAMESVLVESSCGLADAGEGIRGHPTRAGSAQSRARSGLDRADADRRGSRGGAWLEVGQSSAVRERKRRRGELLGLPVRNRYLFPSFQFDFERQRIFPTVVDVNRLLGAADDPWGVASWWFSTDSWLKSARPADLVGDTRKYRASWTQPAPWSSRSARLVCQPTRRRCTLQPPAQPRAQDWHHALPRSFAAVRASRVQSRTRSGGIRGRSIH